MPRIRLTLAYDGTAFCGWQLQARERTVQGELETAIARIVGEPVRVHGSGRTDSGVHALCQVCHFDVPESRATIPWRRALNSLLSDDVSVLSCHVTDAEFHSRYSAVSKTYAYTLWHTREFLLPHRRNQVWACGPVDFGLMERAAEVFLGTHDFAAFQNTGTPVKSTVRTMTRLERCPGINEHESVWRFSADGFLKQMVRNIMGCLVEAGRGKVSPQTIRSILDEADRTAAPATAPPQGLCLEFVQYPAMAEEKCLERRPEDSPDTGDCG
ncbi:tRNA pseudouridine(38-40) synthase TruA [Salidesulfovibrio onnuriiensis]|uniref:tRNA pseudouridine(38-40) synthase TruA n=1 Tax=Salidesulfovibrio onnuriiensis TaxID=2583823 RepID=UPI0011C82158|nr:tRNA pseudouridine(38-40) synthase TruA [Salidesulfovibrio onnuriiensis]